MVARYFVWMLCCVSALLAGCGDQEAARQRQGLEKIDLAIEKAREAERGFVPKNASPMDLQVYRQKQIKDVILALNEAVIATTGDQKTAVSRLLADYYKSTAYHYARNALTHWGRAANDVAYLLDDIAQINRISAQVAVLDVDGSPALDRLQSSKQAVEGQEEISARNEESLRRSIDKLEKQIAGLRADKDALIGRAGQLRRDAFTAPQGSRYELYIQAADTNRNAASKEMDIQTLAVKRDKLQSQLYIEERRNSSADESSVWLGQQIKLMQDHQRKDKGFREAAVQRMQELSHEMFDRFQSVQEQYVEDVTSVLELSAAMADDAIGILSTARSRNRREQSSIELDRLSANLTWLHVVTQQIAIAGSYGRTILFTADQTERHVHTQLEVIRDTADGVVKEQHGLIQEAIVVLEESRQLASDLQEGDSSIVDIAKAYQNYLNSYQKQIDQARL